MTPVANTQGTPDYAMTVSLNLRAQLIPSALPAEMAIAINNELNGASGQGAGADASEGGGESGAAKTQHSYSERWSIRHQILALVDHECPPEVEMLLYHALNENGVCDKKKGEMCSKYHTMEDLIDLGAAKYKNPWKLSYIPRKRYLENRGESNVNWEWERAAVVNSLLSSVHPDPFFRNNEDPNKPALVFEAFPRLPLELRIKVWNMSAFEGPHVITIDADHHKASKIVQVLPENPSSYISKEALVMLKSVLLCTVKESRQVVLESLDTHIYVDITSSPSDDTKKLMFSTKLGDFVFINHLKTCAASVMADSFHIGPKDSFPNNIATLAIHERNFYLCTVRGLDKDAEFVKVAGILRKFTSLKTLYIVVGKVNKQLNLVLASDLEIAYSRAKFMTWSVNPMDIGDFRDMVARYAKSNPKWKVPEIVFLRARIH
ncbi:hypothetical protein DL98DRAFT_590105 [Cadophora sp. DSE1049]|nr:hypothetical protein DL98DRAFT_590105 [Cadophora sp. DSE1049]